MAGEAKSFEEENQGGKEAGESEEIIVSADASLIADSLLEVAQAIKSAGQFIAAALLQDIGDPEQPTDLDGNPI